MFLDYSSTMVNADSVAFPDHVFADDPKPAAQLKETVTITGSSSTSVIVRGSVDDSCS